MKTLSTLLITLFFIFLFTENVEAKVLPQAQKAGPTSTGVAKNSIGTGISVSPKLRADRRALVVYFSNLKNATNVAYLLIYKTNGQEEAAMGGLNLDGSASSSSELLFGTCSKNVCRFHTGITEARLEVSYTSKTGKKYLKKYKIKV